MKRCNHYILPVVLTGVLTMTGSCDTINSLLGRNAKVEKQAVLPSDRETIQKQTSQREYTSAELAEGVVKGDWAIEEVNGKPATGETAPYLKFVPGEKRVYGNNGCNYINAGYTYNPGDSTLTFNSPVTTMRMCDKEGITDIEINTALSNTAYYTWELKGDNYYLYLFDKSHRPMLTLMHQNFEFLNGSWQVVSIDDEPLNTPDLTIVIDVDEGKIHGNTGCNILNGTFDVDLETANTISFQDLITTRMACENPEYETRFLVALEDADHAKPISKDRVLLINSSGKVVLTLKRIQ